LPSGIVNFIGPGDKADSASIQSDGTYTATKVPVGQCKITVSTTTGSGGGLTVGAPGGLPQPPPPVPIPAKYNNAETSGFSLDVKAGSQKFDIPLP